MADDANKPAETRPTSNPTESSGSTQTSTSQPRGKTTAGAGNSGKAVPKQESEAVKTDNENYVGVDPIYKQSAYEEPLEPDAPDVPEDASDEEKEAAEAQFEAEQAMVETVKANEVGCVVETEEPVPFEEWVGEQPSQVAKSRVPGGLSDAREEDMEATEEAKGDEGKIAPHSTSLHQPGVTRV